MTTLYDIGQWYKDKGLVGELQLAIVQTTVAISRKPMGFGLIAPAGSGKTMTIDLLLGDPDDKDDALIKKEYVYFKDAGSEKAFWYDKKINEKPIVVFKELQKDGSMDTIEAIKSMTEGKAARRKVTVAHEDETKDQKIDPKTVLFTYAVENKEVKIDTELSRRCVTMTTDISKSQTENVLTTKALLRWNKTGTRFLTEEQSNNIRRDVNTLLLMQPTVVNPFAEKFSEIMAEIAPDQKIRSMAEHFWDVMEGVTKINHLKDPLYVGENADTIVANIQDLYQTLDVYKSSFLRDVHSIPPIGDIILQGFEDAGKVEQSKKVSKSDYSLEQFGAEMGGDTRWYDINHVRKAIKEHQCVQLAKNIVIQICKQLVDAGYLEDWKDGNTVKYQVQEKFQTFSNFDAKAMLDSAAAKVKETYPDVYERWYNKQFEPYTHPVTGEEVKLVSPIDCYEQEEDI